MSSHAEEIAHAQAEHATEVEALVKAARAAWRLYDENEVRETPDGDGMTPNHSETFDALEEALGPYND